MITNFIYLVLAYFLGNILGGKIVTILYKEDFTEQGSGNIGARNAGRVLGAKAFIFVATIDFFKGFLIIILLKLFNVSNTIIALCMFLVIIGHIKPVLFKFKGGKGVATFLGTVTALSPILAIVLIVAISIIAFFTKSTTVGFYSMLAVFPYLYYINVKSLIGTIIIIITMILLYYVSLDSIKNSFDKYFLVKKRKVIKR